MSQDFSTALQHDRKSLGFSQSDFADLLDVSQQTLSKWEAGTAMPRATKLAELLKIFNDKLDGESETVKTIGQWEIFKLLENKPALDPTQISSIYNTFQNLNTEENGNESDSQLFSFFLNKLRDESKQRKRIQLVKALRDYPSESSENRGPYAALSKATHDLEKASHAMRKATEAVEKALQIIQEIESKNTK